MKVKVGDRIKLIEMEDDMTRLKKGSEGIVTRIEEDQNLIWVEWDNGENLALIDGLDKYKKIKK